MIRKILIIVAITALPSFVSSTAKAQDVSESYCREYTKDITVGGKEVEGYGRACRQPDGSWRIVKLEGPDKVRKGVREFIREDLKELGSKERNERVVIIDRRGDYYNGPYYGHKKRYSYGYGHGYRHKYNKARFYGHSGFFGHRGKGHYKGNRHHYKKSHHGRKHYKKY